MIIDFHTHNPRHEVLSIESLSLRDIPSDHYFTYGLHPWHLAQMNVSEFQTQLLKHHKNKKFIALGETGLDHACAIDFELQRKAFSYQLELASELKIKIVIIHCVRALNEILELYKRSSFKGTMVFHDANFSLDDSLRLVNLGHYLSFGTNLMRENSKANHAFAQLSHENIFLETDDSDLKIEQVYEFAAIKRKTELESLVKQIDSNFKKLFSVTWNS